MNDAGRHPIFAFVYPLTVRLGERSLGPRRTRLLASARGTLVEIGAGTGVNFPHYPPGVPITATEVEPGLIRKAAKAARRYPSIEVQGASAEALPMPDDSIDTIVSTMNLISLEGRFRAEAHPCFVRAATAVELTNTFMPKV